MTKLEIAETAQAYLRNAIMEAEAGIYGDINEDNADDAIGVTADAANEAAMWIGELMSLLEDGEE